MQALTTLKNGIQNLGHAIAQTGKDVAALAKRPSQGGGRKAKKRSTAKTPAVRGRNRR
jgi:hypothetical protein